VNLDGLPPGVIGVATHYLGRYREFDVCLDKIIAPNRTDVRWNMGVNIAMGYNNSVRVMLKEGLQWTWILGDDHTFNSDILVNLLNRNVDVVVPLCLRRQKPFYPVLHSSPASGFKPMKEKGWEFLKGKRGMVDLGNLTCGNAGMLIRRSVLEKMSEPWFEVGQINSEYGSTDLYFCKKLYDQGFKIYLDTDNRLGHITHVITLPVRGPDGELGPDLRVP